MLRSLVGSEMCIRDSYWPENQGFDVNKGGYKAGQPFVTATANGYFSPYGNPRLDDGPPGEYLTDLVSEIDRLHKVRQEIMVYPDYPAMEWLNKVEKVVAGRLAFVKAVYGKEHPIFLSLLQKKIQVSEPEDLSISWRYAGYEYYSI